MELSDAIALMEERTLAIDPFIKRPSKPLKGMSARNPAEQEALCRAVVLSIQKTREEGLIIREFDGGWRIRWIKNNE